MGRQSTLELRFWFPSDPMGEIVAQRTSSDVSHCSVVLDGLEWEALPGLEIGPRFPRPFGGRSYVFKLNVSQSDLVIRNLRKKVGQGYDWGKILSFIFKFVRPSAHKQICSELVMDVMADAGISPRLEGRLAPNDLELLAIQRKFDNLD